MPLRGESAGWIIVGVNFWWSSNDEPPDQIGNVVYSTLYSTREEAEAALEEMLRDFCAEQSPQEFPVNFENYPGLADWDPERITWADCFVHGFPDPFELVELERAGSIQNLSLHSQVPAVASPVQSTRRLLQLRPE